MSAYVIMIIYIYIYIYIHIYIYTYIYICTHKHSHKPVKAHKKRSHAHTDTDTDTKCHSLRIGMAVVVLLTMLSDGSCRVTTFKTLVWTTPPRYVCGTRTWESIVSVFWFACICMRLAYLYTSVCTLCTRISYVCDTFMCELRMRRICVWATYATHLRVSYVCDTFTCELRMRHIYVWAT